MKKLFFTITAVLCTISMFTYGQTDGQYEISKKTSSLEWVGTKITGKHNGTINVKEGNLTVEDGMLKKGILIIDMNSIVVVDIKDSETNAKLKGHLSSDDFFGINQHPTSQLKILKVEAKGGDKFHIHGELTIKGVTEKVEIPATIKFEDNKLVAIGTAEINRTKYGIKYGSGSFFDDLGDKAINDLFTIKFKVGAML